MSAERFGPTIDDLYEQELRAQARTLEVRVSHAGTEDESELVRTFLDTPEGRVRCDKFAMHLLEQPWVDRVEVVPIESAAPHKAAAAGEPRRNHPRVAAGSIRATVVPFNRIHRMQTRRAGLDEAMETHPSAGGVLSSCPGGLDCPECSDRRTR